MMCEPLLPIDALRDMKFSVSAMADLHERGSFQRRQAACMSDGIRAKIDWIMAQLEAAGEGKRNMGAPAPIEA